jgi:hypothetical protein
MPVLAVRLAGGGWQKSHAVTVGPEAHNDANDARNDLRNDANDAASYHVTEVTIFSTYSLERKLTTGRDD